MSAIKTAHSMIIAHSESSFIVDKHKQRTVLSLTRCSAEQDYRALCLLSATNWSHLTSDLPVQSSFDHFYGVVSEVYNNVYPQRTVTVTSRDPLFITPHIKFLLRQRNAQMHAGCIEHANALSITIWVAIAKFNAGRLADIGSTGEGGWVGSDTSPMWKLVNDITGVSSRHFQSTPTGFTADFINTHYASVSTDCSYSATLPRLSCSPAPTMAQWYALPLGRSKRAYLGSLYHTFPLQN